MNVLAQEIRTHWMVIRPLFSLHTEHDYDMAVEHLNELLDEIGTNERHPLYELLDTLGAVIHAYEEQHYPIPESTSGDMIQFFMDE
ncbi:MAG: transcriptional regulator, partial [bacterium]|nr:transcriptional regulator [bacterium]